MSHSCNFPGCFCANNTGHALFERQGATADYFVQQIRENFPAFSRRKQLRLCECHFSPEDIKHVPAPKLSNKAKIVFDVHQIRDPARDEIEALKRENEGL